MKKLVYVIVAFLLIACTNTQTIIRISPEGNDNNPGTHKRPFKSLSRAVDEVRKLAISDSAGDIVIRIDEGVYPIVNTITLGSEFSGAGKRSITFAGAPGKTVEFSGGMEIKNWKKGDNGIWSAEIILPADYDFRELFIDGLRAKRARHPNEGYMRIASAGEDRRTFFRYNENDFPQPSDANNVELVLLHDWSVTRIKVAEIDDSKKIIRAIDTIGAKGLSFFNIDNWEKNPRYFLENSMSFLDTINEYFYNRNNNTVYLKLSDGDDPGEKRILIPVAMNSLLSLEGARGKNISGIHFKNITFTVCGWPLPEGRYAGIQACHYDRNNSREESWNVVPAAVTVENGSNCSFSDCRFRNLGGSGLWLGSGTKNCLVSGCSFEDISGNGIMIGEGNDRTTNGGLWWKTAPGQAADNNHIENCEISGCGRQFFGAVGVWCGLAARTTITGNHIHQLPYTGISVGWLWNPDPTPCRENRIEGNHIHHVMQVLSDGGGIYSLGLQPGSSIINNQIHDIPLNAGRAESNGMFLDEGTTDVIISGNLVYHIAKSPLRFHKATTNLVKDNILSCTDDNPPVRYNNTPVEKIKLENNTILNESNAPDRETLKKAINGWK
jgi:hypothetical protein